MTAFRVGLTRVVYSTGNRVTYLVDIHPQAVEAGAAPLRIFASDEALCQALEQLGVPKPQQERILSVLRRVNDETVSVDISEDVARQFGWPTTK